MQYGKTYIRPSRQQWGEITRRPRIDHAQLASTVSRVLADVRSHGDEAVLRYEEQFDHCRLSSLAVSAGEFAEASRLVPPALRAAIEQAHHNISRFHEAQRLTSHPVETCPGVTCWQRAIAIERVGLYIPGGTAPLFSTVLMLATPARIAGCEEIVLCTPPGKDGRVNPAILVAAQVAGVTQIYKIGGVQAIGAMAYGTETVPRVYKIFGPGNQYVMAAKQQVSLGDVAIDMPAGPSEVCVIADDAANPAYVAADLLSQAEHGRDSQVLLIATSREMLSRVEEHIAAQLAVLPRREIALSALAASKFVVVSDTVEAISLANAYAPEHLIIATADYEQVAERVVNAGSVFLGQYACESAGDYASGTNHTLPTHGYATAYNGVNLDSYVRKVTFQHLTPQGIASIGQTVVSMARAEGLDAHARAMSIRMEQADPDKTHNS